MTRENDVSPSRASPSAAPAEWGLETLLQGSLQAVLLVGGERVTLANEAAAALFGYAGPGELEGAALADLFGPEEAARLLAPDPPAGRMALRGRSRAGQPLALEGRATPVQRDGAPGLLLALVDVTGQAAAADALADSEERFRSLVEASPQGICIHRDNALLFVNRAFAAIFGYESAAAALAVGDLTRFYAPHEHGCLGAASGDAAEAAAGPVRHECEGVRRDGTRIWVETTVRPITWEGQPAVQATVVDISERRRAEEAARNNQRLLQAVVDTIPHAIYVKDTDGRYLMVNRAFAEYAGQDPERCLGRTMETLEVLPPAFRARLREADTEVLRTGRTVEIAEHELARADDEPCYFHHIKCPLLDEAGQVRGVVGLDEDITGRVRAERAAHESRRLLETAVNTVPHAMFVKDLDHRLLMANKAMAAFYGLPPEALVGRTAGELPGLKESEVAEMLRQDRQVIETGEPLEVHEQPLTGRDGTVSLRHLHKLPLHDDQGRIVGLIAVSEDVTEQRRAEEALRRSEHSLRQAQELAHLGDWHWDRAHDRVTCSQEVYRILGRAPGALAHTRDGFLAVLHPDEQAYMGRVIEAAQTTGQPFAVDLRVMQPDGSERHCHVRGEVMRDAAGRATGLTGVVQDITERKRAEEALRTQRTLLRTVFDVLPMATFVKDRDNRFVMINRAMGEQERMVAGEIAERPTYLSPTLTPAEQETLHRLNRHVLDTGESVERHDVPLTIHGERRFYHLLRVPLRDARGRVSGLVGVNIDVTERKRAEEAVQSQRRLLQTVFDSIPEDLYVKDTQGRYLMVNASMAESFRQDAATFIGHTQEELGFYSPHQVQVAQATDREVLDIGRAIRGRRLRTFSPRGQEIHVNLNKLPLKDEHDAVVGIVGMSENITEQVRAEQELDAQRRLLQTVFDVLPLWVFVKDDQRRFLMLNRQMIEDHQFGAPEALVGHIDLNPWLSAEQNERIHRLDQEVLDTGRAVELPELPLTLPGAQQRLFRTLRMPLRNAEGHVVGIVGFNEDVTERRRTAEALQQAQKLESLGVMAGGIAHDFNNLLMPILGNVALARRELAPDSPALALLRQVEQAGQRAADLVRQMLAYSGRGSFQAASADLNQLIGDMGDLLRVSIAKDVSLDFRGAPALPPVHLDPTQIQQVVMNLVLNASEAIGEAPGSVTIETGLAEVSRAELSACLPDTGLPAGRYVFLEVRDDGTGMDPEIVGRIFDPFFTTKFTGRGLGLAAVLGIMRGHRGALRVDSVPGEGTTFRLLFPPADDTVHPPPEPPREEPWRDTGTVLVADDEEAIRTLARHMLESLGYEVVLACNGEEALARYREHAGAIRLVLLDMTMPRLDGGEVLQCLRAEAPALPVLLMSGYSEAALREHLSASHPAAVLQKPFPLATLQQRLRQLLG